MKRAGLLIELRRLTGRKRLSSELPGFFLLPLFAPILFRLALDRGRRRIFDLDPIAVAARPVARVLALACVPFGEG
jgi:hypothetical protein